MQIVQQRENSIMGKFTLAIREKMQDYFGDEKLKMKSNEMISIRPHHLLDIIRDFGNKREVKEHRWGASLSTVTQKILADTNRIVVFVMGVDAICETCSQLQNDICQAEISRDLLMRDYNNRIDRELFEALQLAPGSQLQIGEFLQLVSDNLNVLNIFDPALQTKPRKQGTIAALKEFGIISN